MSLCMSSRSRSTMLTCSGGSPQRLEHQQDREMQNLRSCARLAPRPQMPRSKETRFDELKRYVRFDEADAKALLALRPLAAPHFVRIAREFYERIREHEAAHAV